MQALPTYVMQTTLLPRKVLDDIDKVFRNFLWGDIVNGKKIHLVSWDIICSPKFKGGLGLRKIREVNAAFMMCANWRLCCNETPMWSSFI